MTIKHKVVARLEGKFLRRIIRKDFQDSRKCGGCNWEASTQYSFDSNDIDKEGLCGDCFCSMLVDDKSEVIRK